MLNVRLAGVLLYGKQLFTWLLLVVSLMAFFVLFFFALDDLDEIWDLIESVSEGFLTYSSTADSYLKGSVDISKISTMSLLISRKLLTEYIMQSYWLPFGSAISMQILFAKLSTSMATSDVRMHESTSKWSRTTVRDRQG